MSLVPGREADIEVDGKSYRLGRIERRQTLKFTDWANTKLPDPIKCVAAMLKDLPPETAAIFAREAVSQAGRPRSFDESGVQSLFQTDEGLEEMGAILLIEHQPDLKMDEARKVISKYIKAHGIDPLLEKFIEAQGKKD
jgi:hypothetical protein